MCLLISLLHAHFHAFHDDQSVQSSSLNRLGLKKTLFCLVTFWVWQGAFPQQDSPSKNIHWYYTAIVVWLGSGEVSSIKQSLVSQQPRHPPENCGGRGLIETRAGEKMSSTRNETCWCEQTQKCNQCSPMSCGGHMCLANAQDEREHLGDDYLIILSIFLAW